MLPEDKQEPLSNCLFIYFYRVSYVEVFIFFGGDSECDATAAEAAKEQEVFQSQLELENE